LRENYEQLRELERMRDSLVHMIVHDLRSPLIGMYASLQFLQESAAEKLDDEEREDLEISISSAQTLTEMVSALVDVSRMEEGRMPLNRETCDLRHVISQALGALTGLTRGRSVTYEEPDEPVEADCDAEIMRRVVANLVGNALKFTPPSGEVTVTTHRLDGYVKTAVSDTGPGIPHEYRGKIFEKFGQVETREEGKKYSTGLGLTFCKLAVEAHGGAIGVDSEVGAGSTFWFCLPTPGEATETP
jgi:signal transduction histidine kinase